MQASTNESGTWRCTGALDFMSGGHSFTVLNGWTHTAQGSPEVAMGHIGGRSQTLRPETFVAIPTLHLGVVPLWEAVSYRQASVPSSVTCKLWHSK